MTTMRAVTPPSESGGREILNAIAKYEANTGLVAASLYLLDKETPNCPEGRKYLGSVISWFTDKMGEPPDMVVLRAASMHFHRWISEGCIPITVEYDSPEVKATLKTVVPTEPLIDSEGEIDLDFVADMISEHVNDLDTPVQVDTTGWSIQSWDLGESSTDWSLRFEE